MASSSSPSGHRALIHLILALFFLTRATGIAVMHKLVVRSAEDSALETEPQEIFPRHHANDDSCPISDYRSCGETMPSDFCCPSNQDCMILAANTTALCCPRGDCRHIQPIVCDIALQNVTKHPDASVKTLALDKNLNRCGTACCPFGYLCKNNKSCVRDENQDDNYAFLVPNSSTTLPGTTLPDPTTASPSIETSEVPDDNIPGGLLPTTTSVSEATSSADEGDKKEGSGGISSTGIVTASTVAGVCAAAGIGVFIWMRFFRKKSPSGTASSPQTPYTHYSRSPKNGPESWGYFTSPGNTPMSTRYLHLERGPNDKFVVTPSTAGFSSPIPSPQETAPSSQQGPVELPATPVSLCMWMNLEDASVEEPRLAYVLPPKQPTRQQGIGDGARH